MTCDKKNTNMETLNEVREKVQKSKNGLKTCDMKYINMETPNELRIDRINISMKAPNEARRQVQKNTKNDLKTCDMKDINKEAPRIDQKTRDYLLGCVKDLYQKIGEIEKILNNSVVTNIESATESEESDDNQIKCV